MAELTRFGVSIDAALLKQYDTLLQEKKYANRSEGIRDLIRNALVQEEMEDPEKVFVGSIILVYDHTIRELTKRLIDLQHHHHILFHSTLHIHLDHDNCLEVLVVRGKKKLLQQLSDQLIGTKGVKHGKLVLTHAM